MKLRILGLFSILLFGITAARAQSPEINANMSVSAATTGSGIASSTINFHRITWTTTGNPTSCTVALDKSADNSSWTSGGAIGNQTCTNPGDSGNVNIIANYVRIRVSAIAGGTVNVSYHGYIGALSAAAPGPIGATTPSSATFTTIALSGSAPSLTTPGTTPYLNNNTLTKGTQNTCTFALTTSTLTTSLSPVSLCTYTLPNAAVTWYWSCTMGWSSPAGTTPTFAIGVNWAQAPTTAFQMASILTANNGTGTQLTTATTTNSNILATGTISNSATVFQATASGTFTASATSGTFTPTAVLTGTNATGTAVGGCTIQ
jgi:hypothetical protein